MTAQHDTARASARDRILDAAQNLICAQGVAGFTLDAVAQAAKVSKGGLLYHFGSKDKLISDLQCRMALRLAEKLQDADCRSEPLLLAFIRLLRHDFENGGQHFAPLLLAREQENPSWELQASMTCLMRRSGITENKKAAMLLFAGLGLVLSSLARLPCSDPRQVAELFDEMEAIAATISA
jgi:AcrR family transcriptional regulator